MIEQPEFILNMVKESIKNIIVVLGIKGIISYKTAHKIIVFLKLKSV
jgi:hypothetical protein